eukprot:6795486-Prorocentrum_lima.AAC.1
MIEKLHDIIDARIGRRKLYIYDNLDDLTITVRLGARDVHILQLVQAPSGRLLLPCTDYAKGGTW